MKRLLLLLIIAGVATGGVMAQDDTPVVYEPDFRPQSAEIMAQGGSFTANAEGFYSLFTNPAGFSKGKSSLTLVAAAPWAYVPPDPEMIDAALAVADDPASLVDTLAPLLTDTGTGAGMLGGFGWVGNGFGLGAAVVADAFASGPNILGVKVNSTVTMGFVTGLALPLNLGSLTLTPAGSVRPMYRLAARNIGVANFADVLAGNEGAEINADVLHGMGIGFDAGVNAELGPLTASLVLRNFGGTEFRYSRNTFTETQDALMSGQLPEGTEVTDVKHVIPMTAHLGAEFHPNLGGLSKLIDPKVHGEYVMNLDDSEEVSSIWTNLHVGAEVRLLGGLIHARGGLNQGYVTMGAGVKLLFMEAHVAFFSRELGDYPGAKQNPGVAAEVALRF